jgi:archaeal chaperonin
MKHLNGRLLLKMENSKYQHIQFAVEFAELVKTTLGPRGMNTMVVDDSKGSAIITNDGATIVNSLKSGNQIVELFKGLARAQELAVGDGTTTAVILSGQLLSNALILLNKGVHPTIIMGGYELARSESMKFLKEKAEEGDRLNIIKTSFGTKLQAEVISKLTELMLSVKNPKELKVYPLGNCDSLDSEIFKGYVFGGFTINDRMKDEITGKIAVLDFPVNWKMNNYTVTSADEMEKVQNLDSKFKKDIVEKLKELGVVWVFYTDTAPEFETYLTEAGISGVVCHRREDLDGICKAVKSVSCASLDQIKESHIGTGHVKYEKQLIGNSGSIYVDGDIETLILRAQTSQVLDEEMRACDDVIRLLKHDLKQVTGAGAIEIELSLHLRDFSKNVGGKMQIAVEKFADSIESIPTTLAENCGLDAIDVITTLKTLHAQGNKDLGIDIFEGISDAKKRGVVEPVLIKTYAIGSATAVAYQILKIDKVIGGELK